MAPIPEENQEKPPNGNKDDSDINNFSNVNQMVFGASDSSDEDEIITPGGYSLLPQEPDDDSESQEHDDDDDVGQFCHEGQNAGYEGYDTHSLSQNSETTSGVILGDDPHNQCLSDTVLSSEAGVSAPTVAAANVSCHPSFLSKYPDGKIPSYMQVPSLPKDKDGLLWNQKRQEPDKLALDSVQESKILKAMSGFSLPTDSIPEWAKNLPDDQWRVQILHRIGSESSSIKHYSEGKSESNEHKEVKASAKSSEWIAEFPDFDQGQH